MATIYSTVFMANTATEAEAQEYVVPSGFVAVIRDISAVFTVPAPGFGSLFNIATQDVQFLRQVAAAGTVKDFHRACRVVVPAGESFLVSVEGELASVEIVVSGYLLTAP